MFTIKTAVQNVLYSDKKKGKIIAQWTLCCVKIPVDSVFKNVQL